MQKQNVQVGRFDLRWLDTSGNIKKIRGMHDYAFRSSITDKAQQLLEANGFVGSYVRHLSTGHNETEMINLAMMSFAQRYNSIVGVTLDSLVSDKIAKWIIGYPAGRILYEMLANPIIFQISTDREICMPDFDDDYAAVDFFKSKSSGKMEFVPDKKEESANKQADRIRKNIYIELNPEFIANLSSVDMNHGLDCMASIRQMTEREKVQLSSLL